MNVAARAGWAEDLTYDYYARIVRVLSEQYTPVLMRDAPLREPSDKPHAIPRHDADVCVEAALRLAQLEAKLGLRSTYMLLIRSPFYDSRSARFREIVRELIALGHEVGLHFDIEDYPTPREWSTELVEQYIGEAADFLSAVAGEPVRSFSYHRPVPQFLRGRTYVGGLVNAYATEFMEWYLSDSMGNWREGEPLKQLLNPRARILQILTHPIWWGDQHLCSEDRLEVFRREKINEWPDKSSAEIEDLIYHVLAVRPRVTQ